MEFPKVRLIYAYPLDEDRRQLFSNKNLGHYPSWEEVRDKTVHWRKVWEEANQDDRVIRKLQELTKRVPDRSLECFVIGGGINPLSTPLIISVMDHAKQIRSDEDFIETLIHEIAHVFVSDVNPYFNFIKEKYSEESITTRNHIIIYALLEKIYRDLFDALPTEFESPAIKEGYARAIEIVKQEGCDKLIEEYHSFV